jgi:glycosyltransferase involved in cell wall biosynthesis
MRIAFVTFEYPPFIIGGAGVYAFNITHELAKLGHQIVIFVPDILGINYSTNFANIEFKRVRINGKLPFRALYYWLNLPLEVESAEVDKKFDIIHFNGISYWFLKKKISAAPHIITIHHLVTDAIKSNKSGIASRIKDISGETSFFITFLERRCINSADKIIAVSNFTKNQIINTYNLDSSKVCVVYNGIDLERYNYSEEMINDTKKHLNLDGKPVILFVGRINDPRKGLKFLLFSLQKIITRFDLMLVVVGKGDQEELKNFSKSLGIYDNVLFAGFVDDSDLKKYYSACDVYVCPSRLEGFGLTILEAMAAGKPIVGTKVGAIPELIKNGVNGVLVDSEDINSMSHAICSLLQDKVKANYIGRENLNFVRDNFNWKKCTKDIVNIYDVQMKVLS